MRSIEILQENIKSLLQQKEKSRHWLAKTTGLSITAIYSLEKETFNPKVETLEKIASALNVEIAELYLDHRKNKITSITPPSSSKDH